MATAINKEATLTPTMTMSTASTTTSKVATMLMAVSNKEMATTTSRKSTTIQPQLPNISVEKYSLLSLTGSL